MRGFLGSLDVEGLPALADPYMTSIQPHMMSILSSIKTVRVRDGFDSRGLQFSADGGKFAPQKILSLCRNSPIHSRFRVLGFKRVEMRGVQFAQPFY